MSREMHVDSIERLLSRRGEAQAPSEATPGRSVKHRGSIETDVERRIGTVPVCTATEGQASPGRAKLGRRALLGSCCCCSCFSGLRAARAGSEEHYSWYDALFAWVMQYGMARYEASMAPVKAELFERLFHGSGVGGAPAAAGLAGAEATAVPAPFRVLEIGFGTGPNLPYYARVAPQHLQVTGLEPKISMRSYAVQNAAAAGFSVVASGSGAAGSADAAGTGSSSGGSGRTLELLQGRAEALPFDDAQFDAAVCTLVLCSVADPGAVLGELHRVLKPGGRLLFLEHVVSPEPGLLRTGQTLLDPLQQWLADGCHLTRDSLAAIERAGFFVPREEERDDAVQVAAAQRDGGLGEAAAVPFVRRLRVSSLGVLAPHVLGVALKA